MTRSVRIGAYALATVLAVLLIGVALVFILTRTDWGVERVGRFAVDQIGENIQGELRVGRVSSEGLLGTVTLHDVVIDDTRGRPFLRVDSARLEYHWRTLARGRVAFDRFELFAPDVVLERLPGDTAWNYDYVFEDTGPDEGDSLVLFEKARIVDGRLTIRVPWSPDPGEPVEPGDTARLIIERVPGGLARTYRFDEVDAVLPRALWESPVEEGKLFEIDALATRGYIWETPFDLRDLGGTVTVRDSVISFQADRFRLPSTHGSGLGQIVTGGDRTRVDIQVDGEEVALRDLQWLHPPLPDDGGGSLDLRIQSQQPTGTLWYAEDLRLRAPGTQLAGSFGVVTGDTLYFTRVDLRASPLNLALLEDVLPGDLPVEGLLVGTVEVEGPVSALTTRGDVRIARSFPAEAASSVRWNGTVDLRDPFVPRELTAEVQRLDPDLLDRLPSRLRGIGPVSGELDVTGRDDRSVEFTASMRPAGETSTLEASGTFDHASERPSLDIEVRTDALRMGALAEAFPGLEALSDEVEGSVDLRGPLDDLDVRADLDLASGRVLMEGRVDALDPTPRYRGRGQFTNLRIDGLGLPVHTTGRFQVDGEDAGLAHARAGLQVDLQSLRVGNVGLGGGRIGVTLRDGLLHVDTASLRGQAGRLRARGTFGAHPDRTGRLAVMLDSDSVGAVRPIAFSDTLAIESSGEWLTRLDGRIQLRAVLEGSVAEFDADADLVAEALAIEGGRADRIEAHLSGRAVGTDQPRVRMDASAESLAIRRQQFDSVRVSADYAAPEGTFTVGAADGDREHRLAGRVERRDGGAALRLDAVRIETGDGPWELQEPARLRIDRSGIRVAGLDLVRGGDEGRIRATGRLPWRPTAGFIASSASRPVRFRMDVEGVRLGRGLGLAWPDPVTGGTLAGSLEIRGTTGAPVVESQISVDGLRFDDTAIDRMNGEFIYADQRLNGRFAVWRDGHRMVTGEGRVPVDLSMIPVEQRRLAAALDVAVQADRVPAALISSLEPGFDAVEGWVDGRVILRGTTRDPTMEGSLTLQDGAATWTASGVRYRELEGRLRMLGERVVAVDGRARTENGEAVIDGTATFRPLNDPAFDLTVRTTNFQTADRPEVELVTTGEIRLGGRYRRPIVTGGLRVDAGAFHLDEVWRDSRVVELRDPLLFDMMDSADGSVRPNGAEAGNPFLGNLVVDAAVDVGRDFWLRGRNLNIELSGDITLSFDRRAEDLRLSGTLNAIRGSYQLQFHELYTRRFEVRRGTVEFVGTPGIDPNLGIITAYRVRTAQGDPLEVRAEVTGTLKNPRVQLASDTEQTISETDLVSYVLFGRPAYALAPGQSRVLQNRASMLGMLGMGVVAPSVLGYAASGLENALGLDYVAITGADPLGRGIGGTDGGLTDAVGSFGAEVEVGWYLSQDLYSAFTQRIVTEDGAVDYGVPGVRLEWRFHPTWTVELFWEDRIAWYPSFGPGADPHARSARGFFLFREWGY